MTPDFRFSILMTGLFVTSTALTPTARAENLESKIENLLQAVIR